MTEQPAFDWTAQCQRLQEQGMLLAEVRRRDGDACRVCRVIVPDRNRKSATARNFRILNPGTALTAAGVVVVCRQHLVEGEVQPAPEQSYWMDIKPAQRRAAQAAAAVELQKVRAAEEAAEYAYCESRVQSLQTFTNWTVQELTDLEANGAPAPISGDPVVTLQEAIDRGAVSVTKGLPAVVVWRRENPELAKTHTFFEFKSARLGMWPAPSHEALTDSITALAGVQRRLMIGGRLRVRS